MLELSPSYFIPRKPLVGADNSYSEFNRKITHTRFKDANIQEQNDDQSTRNSNTFTPSLSALATDISIALPPFPSVSELNDEFDSTHKSGNPDTADYEGFTFSSDSPIASTIPLTAEQKSNSSASNLEFLVPKII